MTGNSSSERRTDNPLQGVKVLELTQYIAGPFAGQQLVDFGADVIKVERPGLGDPFRTYMRGERIKNFGVNYRAYNKGKKSIALDLQKPEAQEILRRLATKVDVVLENFRPGVLDRLGIGYDALRKLNPSLIFCSVSGFSDDGPYRNRPAFDTVGQALSGILYSFADPEDPKLRGPTLVDQATALGASNAILAALYGRSKNGQGTRIDISMVDASIGFIPDMHSFYTDAGVTLKPDDRAATSQAYIMRCADGMIAFQLGGLANAWTGLTKMVGLPELATDPRFAEREARAENWDELQATLRPVFMSQKRGHWEKLLAAADIPYAPVLSIPEVHEDPEVKHSALFREAEHPVAGAMTMMRRVSKFDGSRGPDRDFPALLGEHTDSVLRDVGYSEAEVEGFRSAGLIGERVGG